MGGHQADVAELEGVLEILCRPYYVGFHPVTFGSRGGAGPSQSANEYALSATILSH
jgi:hypothetical protein